MALQNMPAKTYQPKSVLNQCASMLMIQSQAKCAAEHREEDQEQGTPAVVQKRIRCTKLSPVSLSISKTLTCGTNVRRTGIRRGTASVRIQKNGWFK